MKRSYAIIGLLFFFLCLRAQTVVWNMLPSDYSSIERIYNNLYKVTRNGKIGLINADGTIVADVVNDNLSDFYENRAILTTNDGIGERVVGCLTDDGHYYAFSENYYTLNGQKFYSDGVLSVSNANKQLGYIDEFGAAVVGFDGRYDKIKPFVEGYAAVFKNKKYYLIDKDGIAARFKFDGVGEVYGGTNAYNGKVYIWDTRGTAYTYDIAHPNNVCRKASLPDVSFDYLYRFISVSNKTKEVPFVKEINKGVAGLSPVVERGLYGFVSNGKIILPYQLTSATQFEDNYSVAGIDGCLGILRYVSGESFSVQFPVTEYDFIYGGNVNCSFTLVTPSVWRDRELRVVVKDENELSVETSNVVNTYKFKVTPLETCVKEYRVIVYADRLKLYSGSVSCKFVRLCNICKKQWSVCYGKHDTKDNVKNKSTVEMCPVCKKPVNQCDKRGIH